MKTSATIGFMMITVLIVVATHKTQAQSWVIGGNTVTKDTTLGTKNGFALRFITSGLERMRISATGNIGIGTLSPSTLLDVRKPGSDEVARFTAATNLRIKLYEGSASRGYIGSFAGAVNDVDFGTDGGNTNGSLHLAIKTVPVLTINSSANVGIGTTLPNASSLLEMASTSKGFLMPRMTKSQRDAIVSPATGLLIYQTDSIPGFYYFSGAWNSMSIPSKADTKDNIFLGIGAGTNISTGIENTGIGNSALNQNQTGSGNIAIGKATLFLNSTGSSNTAVGDQAMVNNTTGSSNSAFGYQALYSNTAGINNNAFGYKSLYNNLGVGFGGIFNNAFGTLSLYQNTTGSFNSAFGQSALTSNTTGSSNTGIGQESLYDNTTGNENTALGSLSLNSNSTGSWNTAIGNKALFSNTAQDKNTAIGWSAGDGQQSAASTYVGFNAHASTVVNGSMALGINATVTASNQVRVGTSAITSIGGYVNWSNVSDGRVKKNVKANVPGLSFINKLKPVTYTLNLDAADKIIGNKGDQPVDKINKKDRTAKEAVVYSGFIAQDVEKLAKELNYEFSGVDAAKNDHDLYGLRYAEFVIPLVKAVQELSQQNEVLRREVDELKATMAAVSTNNVSSKPVLTFVSTDAALDQNMPNPFNVSTIIGYSLPQKFSKAQILITDKTGKTIKYVNISGPGKGTLSVDASTLASGAYQYALIVDGKQIASKQMVLAK